MKWERFPFKIEKQYRLKGWDYRNEGYYFITICTKDRVNYFGEVVNSKFIASKIGVLVEKIWNEIPKHFDNIDLDKFVVMPNHIHGFVVCKNVGQFDNCRNMPWHVPTKDNVNGPWHVPTKDNVNGPWHVPTKINEFSKPISKSVSMVINHFKGCVKRECNKNNIVFNWQSRFHDRIIRNKKELWAKIRYIENNQKNWNKDKNNVLVV